MADNVVYPAFITKLDLPPDKVLEGAIGKVEGIIVIGETPDGEPYFASSYGGIGDMLLLVERFKAALLEQ